MQGGFVSNVVRVGDTVRRFRGERADFVHDLLRLLAVRGYSGAPRLLGLDLEGREILTYIEGYVPWADPYAATVTGDDTLVSVAQLVREFHDLTAGSTLAGRDEVVCHNDLSPKNTVYRGDGLGFRAVAFVDWDIASPGKRIHDIGHMCWQYVGLGPECPHGLTEAARRARVLCDAYQLDDRSEVISAVLWWQDRCWRGIEALAETGQPAMIALRDRGASVEVRAAYDWVREHRHALEALLR